MRFFKQILSIVLAFYIAFPICCCIAQQAADTQPPSVATCPHCPSQDSQRPVDNSPSEHCNCSAGRQLLAESQPELPNFPDGTNLDLDVPSDVLNTLRPRASDLTISRSHAQATTSPPLRQLYCVYTL